MRRVHPLIAGHTVMSFEAMLYDWPENIVRPAQDLRIRMDWARQRAQEAERGGNLARANAYAETAYVLEEELVALLAANNPPIPVAPCWPRPGAPVGTTPPDPNAEPPLWVAAQMQRFRDLCRPGPQRRI